MDGPLVVKKYKFIDNRRVADVMRLWNEAYPVQLRFESTDQTTAYLNALVDARHFFLVGHDQSMYGWAALFTRNDTNWFAVILATSVQGMGFGTVLLDHLKKESDSLSGWVVDHAHYLRSDGTVYQSPLGFYLKNGFCVCPEERFETENLSAVKILWKKRKNP